MTHRLSIIHLRARTNQRTEVKPNQNALVFNHGNRTVRVSWTLRRRNVWLNSLRN